MFDYPRHPAGLVPDTLWADAYRAAYGKAAEMPHAHPVAPAVQASATIQSRPVASKRRDENKEPK